jgi:type III secretory pathway component EscU
MPLATALSILITYWRLFLISRRHAHRIHAHNQVALRRNQPARPNKKALKTLLIVVLTSTFCHLLPVLATLFFVFTGNTLFSQLLLFLLTSFPTMTNSWLNVVIFYLRNQDIHQATNALLTSYYTFIKRHIPFMAKQEN